MAGRRTPSGCSSSSSSSSSGVKKKRSTVSTSSSTSSIVSQLSMLRNFCPDFSEKDLSACLSQSGYNVELAAERLMTGQYKPTQQATATTPKPFLSSYSKAAPSSNGSRSSSRRSSSHAAAYVGTPADAVISNKKRSSPEISNAAASVIASSDRPTKKKSPHIIPPTPRQNVTTTVTTTTTPRNLDRGNYSGAKGRQLLLLLCERWLVGECTQRHSRVAHQERLSIEHASTGNKFRVRFRSSRVEGNLCRSLSAMLTPLLQLNLLHLDAEALMDDTNIPMGGEVPLKLTCYLKDPRAFFALFEDQTTSTKSSMYFSNQNNQGNKNKMTLDPSKMTTGEAAFAFLQWAEYGNLPEIPEFSAAAVAKTTGDDSKINTTSSSSSDDSEEDDVILQEEDFAAEEISSDTQQPEWADSVNNAETDASKQQLPELDDPTGLDSSVTLRPYQRQALYWMMRREQEGESREELEKELELLSELASNQAPRHISASAASASQQGVFCDCGPVLVSQVGKEMAKTLDGESNPVNHPLWKPRYLAQPGMSGAILFYVNELLGIATCQPPAPPRQCSGGILADDMGLGKTVMLLALICKYKETVQNESKTKKHRPTLVVAPLSLISQWEEEINTKSSLSCLVCYGEQVKTKSSNDEYAVDVVITTYGTMQAELQRQKKSAGARGYNLLQQDWLRVILDEAHCIKNQHTLASKACCAIEADYRWVVTGTIIHNSLDDVFGLLKFLRHQPWCEPAFWKTAITTEMNRTAVKQESNDEDVLAEPSGMMVALGRVRRLLGPLMLRRTKNSLNADGQPILTLPPVETKIIEVHLTPAETEFYNALLAKSQNVFDGFIKTGTAHKSWFAIFSLLHRLRMSCDHIALTVKAHVDEDEWNASTSGMLRNTTKDESLPAKTTPANADSVDDTFINGLLQKFRNASKGGTDAENTDVAYSSTVVQKLNGLIKDDASHVDEECPICLDRPLIHEACMTSCAHIFCRKCLLDVLQTNAPAEGNVSTFVSTKFPDGDCPTCQSKVESSKIILLSKDKKGKFTSMFLEDKKKSPVKSKSRASLSKKNEQSDVARHILQNAVNGAESAKQLSIMTELEEIWKLDPGSNIVIFSQFLGFLSILETSLREKEIPFGRLDGSMTLKQRAVALAAFKSKERSSSNSIEDKATDPVATKSRKGSVMLVSMKAGGCGLNLVSASTVFLCDPWWSNALEEQCLNRVHRIGQNAKVVRVRKFVVQGSVEERIVELQGKKKDMESQVYSNNQGTVSSSRPTLDDFRMIFSDMT